MISLVPSASVVLLDQSTLFHAHRTKNSRCRLDGSVVDRSHTHQNRIILKISHGSTAVFIKCPIASPPKMRGHSGAVADRAPV